MAVVEWLLQGLVSITHVAGQIENAGLFSSLLEVAHMLEGASIASVL